MRGNSSMGDDAGVGQLPNGGMLAIRLHHRDHESPFLVAGDLRCTRPAHLEHDVGISDRIVRHGCAGDRELGIWNARFRACSPLDGNIGAERFHFLHRFRSRRDPALIGIELTRYRNAHSVISSSMRQRCRVEASLPEPGQVRP
jgi:hypothetical protein